MKSLKILLLLALFFSTNLISAQEMNQKSNIWLVAPLSNEWVQCYIWKENWTSKFEDITDPEKCKAKKWILVQKLEDSATTSYSAIWLLNKYLWMLLNVLIKIWVLVAMWFIVVWGIMMSKAWADDNKSKSWKDKLMWWLASLLVIILWWVILHTVNPLFYVW